MRFRRWPRVPGFEDTTRKRAVLQHAQRRQRDRHPLLATIIAEAQPSADEEMTRRAEQWFRTQLQARSAWAQTWRRARKRLDVLPGSLRTTIREVWAICPYPADPGYMLDLPESIERGRIDPERPPWRFPRPLSTSDIRPSSPELSRPRTRQNVATFDKIAVEASAMTRTAISRSLGPMGRPAPSKPACMPQSCASAGRGSQSDVAQRQQACIDIRDFFVERLPAAEKVEERALVDRLDEPVAIAADNGPGARHLELDREANVLAPTISRRRPWQGRVWQPVLVWLLRVHRNGMSASTRIVPSVLDQLRSAGPLVPPSCAVSPLTLYAPEMRASPQGLQCWRLTPTNSLAYVASMAATLIFRDRVVFGDRDFAEFVIWQVPTPVPPTRHGFKYRLVYVVNGLRVIGFDNERGKGDHQHTEGQERPYTFRGVDQLMMDFVGSIEAWRKSHGKS